ncbi:hypothetical protein JOB18_003431 [Solea senegalensis]|uniref:Reelin domain-containing protein n=1 Tax=Solea senegalensis TaxID=28829 RepID=A0AAV6PG27_SOLSE|nr:hypothetical protein JOB18_003431 [Solea senegalensis]
MGVVLFTLAPPATAFSRGASHTSCQEMIPRHIRAHPQDPPHSYVTLRASASSYLPGQFITVTVRSSRDFMGFLLQARSVGRAGAGVEVRARGEVGVRGGSRSSRIGPVLVGGSWTFTPPGTHTLHCLSEGDTLTHSDKQLKRNLSFVWRAPDVPMGDIQFYITVVQSYFVYWAGIKSEVVRDGSQKLWNGRKTTEKDGGTFAEQENGRMGPTEPTRPQNSRTRGYDSLETVIRQEIKNLATLTTLGNELWTNQTVSERNKMATSGSPHFTTSGSATYSNAALASSSSEPPNHRLQPNTSVGDVNKSQPEPSQSGPRQTSPPYAECQTTDFFRTLPQPQPIKQPESDSLHESMSSSPKSWFQSTLHTGSPLAHSFEWKKTEPPQTPPSLTHLQFTIRYGPILATNQGKDVTTHDPQAKIKSISPIFAISSTTEPMFSGSTPQFSSGKSQPKTTPALSVPPSPFPISVPPHVHPVKPSSTHSVASSNSSSPFVSITPVPLSNPPSSPSTFSKMITASTFPSSPSLISTASIPPTPPLVPTTSSYSLGSSYSIKLTKGESLKIQKHLVPSDPEPNLTPPTQRTVLHQIPDPHPKLDPNIKLNRGRELKPNHPNTDTKQKHPSNPSGTPDKEGKYPDIIPRHSAWELGMLLGCSAGLGMVLVVVIRYMYRQACGKRTGVTLNDREREYERGERGLIHVQECGDLVRVRRIRENSFVLLAEYDILASPGD